MAADAVLPSPVTEQRRRTITPWARVRSWIPSLRSSGSTTVPQQLEDHCSGYPRYSALIASDPSFAVFRRFGASRTRLLLYKQDEISMLEEELEKIDRGEPCVLFLGARRKDTNPKRKGILQKLEEKIAEYDSQLDRYRIAMTYEPAKDRDIENLRNWCVGNGAIARKETAYLAKEEDMMNPIGSPDAGITLVGSIVEDVLIRAYRQLWGALPQRLSRDENVHILPGGTVLAWSKCIIAWLAVSLLLVPLLILYHIHEITYRFVVILGAMAVFILTLSFFGKARTQDLLLASVWWVPYGFCRCLADEDSYVAVMVVFIAGNGP